MFSLLFDFSLKDFLYSLITSLSSKEVGVLSNSVLILNQIYNLFVKIQLNYREKLIT